MAKGRHLYQCPVVPALVLEYTTLCTSSLLMLLKDEYFISFYIDFHWFNASTMPFTTIYHRLLWILQYCLGEIVFLFITSFRAIFRNFHHNPPRVIKTFKMVFSWRQVIKKRLEWLTPTSVSSQGSQRSEASWRFQELPEYRRLSKGNTSNQVKTRRFHQISENIEDSRTPRVREPPLVARLEEVWWLILRTSSNEDSTWSLFSILHSRNVGGHGFNLKHVTPPPHLLQHSMLCSTPPSLPWMRFWSLRADGMLLCHHKIPSPFL